MVLAEMELWTVEYGNYIDDGHNQKQIGSVVIMAPTRAEALRRAPLATRCNNYDWIHAYPGESKWG